MENTIKPLNPPEPVSDGDLSQDTNPQTPPPVVPSGVVTPSPAATATPNVPPPPAAAPTPPPPAPAPAVPPPLKPDNSPSSLNDGDGPKAYLVEYFLALVMTGTLIGIAISFFRSIVNSIGRSDTLVGAWASSFSYTGSLVAISTAIVFIAALILVSRRNSKVEANWPEIKQNRWRKGFLGVFLVLVGLAGLWAAVALVYNLVSLLASLGITDVNFADSARSIITSAFSVALLGATLALYSQDYSKGTMNSTLSLLHHYGLIVGVLVLTVIFFFVPLKAHRDSFIDNIASNDIRTLRTAVDGYARENNELPEDLSDLDLNGDIEGRLENYEYEPSTTSYELCAEFRTDTTGEKTSRGNPLEEALLGSAYRPPSVQENNPSYHKKGRQCFEYDVFLSSFNRQNDSLFGDSFFDEYDDFSDFR